MKKTKKMTEDDEALITAQQQAFKIAMQESKANVSAKCRDIMSKPYVKSCSYNCKTKIYTVTLVDDSRYEFEDSVGWYRPGGGICSAVYEPWQSLNKKENIIGHPNHYCEGRKYEPKDVIRDWGLNFNLGNAVKYISRNGRKDGNSALQDLKKARQYLDFEIEYLEKETK